METIIGLLIVLLPLVFKLIEKRLQNAAQNQQQEAGEAPVEDWVETVRKHIEQQQAQNFVYENVEVVEKNEVTQPVQEAPKAVVPKKKPILLEEEKKEKEKIDVKKMIVYSEIMSPKYAEKD